MHQAQRQWARWVMIVVAVASSAAGGTAFGDAVRLLESVRMEAGREVVRLSDVAALEGEAVARFGDAVILERPGARTVVTLDDVRNVLEDQGANLGRIAFSGRECTVSVPAAAPAPPPIAEAVAPKSEVVVDPWASQLVDEPTLRGRVALVLSRHWLKVDPSDVQLGFDKRDEATLSLGTDRFEFEVIPIATPRSSRVPVTINAYQGKRLVATHRVTVDVRIRRPVVMLKRTVGRGERLQADDLIEEVRLIEPHPVEPVASASLAIGQTARGRLVEGQVLRVEDVEAPLAVQSGAEVTIRTRAGSFIVRMRGRVLEDGRVGDVVRVRRLTDRTELKAIVEPDGQLTLVP